ncbi:MAG: cell division protein ZapA [Fibrobacteraceae bacterium]|nr:cell division protein ZapA [Fibrobacteraceae bacterium]
MDESDSSLRTTRVEIGKDRFQIQTDLSEAELSAIVEFVSKKIQDQVNSDARMDMRKQMILMAMDITSELFEYRRRSAKYKSYYEESQKMAKILADLLEDGIRQSEEPEF